MSRKSQFKSMPAALNMQDRPPVYERNKFQMKGKAQRTHHVRQKETGGTAGPMMSPMSR